MKKYFERMEKHVEKNREELNRLRNFTELIVLDPSPSRTARQAAVAAAMESASASVKRPPQPPQMSSTQTVTRMTVEDLIIAIRTIGTTAEIAEEEKQKAYMLVWPLIWPFLIYFANPNPNSNQAYRGGRVAWPGRVAWRRTPTFRNLKTPSVWDPEYVFDTSGRDLKLDMYLKAVARLNRTKRADDVEREVATVRKEWFARAVPTFQNWLRTTESTVYIVMADSWHQPWLSEWTQRGNVRAVTKSSLPPEYQALLKDDEIADTVVRMRGEPSLL